MNIIMAKIFEIKATLVGLKWEVSRTFQVNSLINLQILNEVFQALFGWENYHLHFYRDMNGHEIKKEDQVILDQVISKEKTLTYIYDFGDSWTLKLDLLNAFEDSNSQKYPICISGVHNAPPEDSGGVTGYEMALEMIKDKPKEFSLLSEWYGDDFDPEYFNLDETNNKLSRLRGFSEC